MYKISKKEEANRETWIKIMNARDLRHQLRECYRR
jgi:hypothetical protein